MAEYARPERLVSSEWLSQHLQDPGLRIVELDVDTSAYDQVHIPGAVGWNWQTELCDQVRRDILTKDQFERLMSESGSTRRLPSCSMAIITPGSPPMPSGSAAIGATRRINCSC